MFSGVCSEQVRCLARQRGGQSGQGSIAARRPARPRHAPHPSLSHRGVTRPCLAAHSIPLHPTPSRTHLASVASQNVTPMNRPPASAAPSPSSVTPPLVPFRTGRPVVMRRGSSELQGEWTELEGTSISQLDRNPVTGTLC